MKQIKYEMFFVDKSFDIGKVSFFFGKIVLRSKNNQKYTNLSLKIKKILWTLEEVLSYVFFWLLCMV